MRSVVSNADFPHFKRVLQARHRELREVVHRTLLRNDQEQYAQIAGQVHDTLDEALADLLVDINLADITREIQELRDIDAALRRISLGTYGVCVGCREPIERERLDAYPSAKRCVACQGRTESAATSPPTPSL